MRLRAKHNYIIAYIKQSRFGDCRYHIRACCVACPEYEERNESKFEFAFTAEKPEGFKKSIDSLITDVENQNRLMISRVGVSGQLNLMIIKINTKGHFEEVLMDTIHHEGHKAVTSDNIVWPWSLPEFEMKHSVIPSWNSADITAFLLNCDENDKPEMSEPLRDVYTFNKDCFTPGNAFDMVSPFGFHVTYLLKEYDPAKLTFINASGDIEEMDVVKGSTAKYHYRPCKNLTTGKKIELGDLRILANFDKLRLVLHKNEKYAIEQSFKDSTGHVTWCIGEFFNLDEKNKIIQFKLVGDTNRNINIYIEDCVKGKCSIYTLRHEININKILAYK